MPCRTLLAAGMNTCKTPDAALRQKIAEKRKKTPLLHLLAAGAAAGASNAGRLLAQQRSGLASRALCDQRLQRPSAQLRQHLAPPAGLLSAEHQESTVGKTEFHPMLSVCFDGQRQAPQDERFQRWRAQL